MDITTKIYVLTWVNPDRVRKLSSSRGTRRIGRHNDLRAGGEPGGHRVITNGDIDIDLLPSIKGWQRHGARRDAILIGDAIITLRIPIWKMPGRGHLQPGLRLSINQQPSSD